MTHVAPAAERHLAERRFYGAAALVAALIAFVGFAPTYYLKGVFGAPALKALVHVHGIVMTLWILLFFAQVALVAARRVDLHRRLGVAGAALAAIVVVVGIATAIDGARRGVSPGPPPLVFLAIPIGVALVFGLFVGAAVLLRRRSDWHKRLMLLASIAILTPAIARLPVEAIHAGGIVLFFALTDLLAIACAAYDAARNKRLHPAFGWGTLGLVLAQVGMLVLAGSSFWLGIAKSLVG
ncbi:MAG: hypothetical protein OEX21_03035 [Betaproteobacteria bacterium]|nr:hypothetical protein [Betaproteobacteria bacterium]